MRSINKPPLISLIQPNLELKTFSPASLLSITASTYPRWNIYRRMKIGWAGGKKLEKFHHQNSNSSTRRENCHFELAGSRGGGKRLIELEDCFLPSLQPFRAMETQASDVTFLMTSTFNLPI